MRHRCLRKMPLYAGFSPSVSARALIILAPILRSFAHTGMRPQWNTSRRSVAVGVGDDAVDVVGRGDVEVLAEGFSGERGAEVLGDRLGRTGGDESAAHRRPSSPIVGIHGYGSAPMSPPVRRARVVAATLACGAFAGIVAATAIASAGGVETTEPPATIEASATATSGVPAFADGEEARQAAEELLGAYIESEFGVTVADAACSVPPSGEVGERVRLLRPQARRSRHRPAGHGRPAAARRARAARRPAADDDDVARDDAAPERRPDGDVPARVRRRRPVQYVAD